MPSPHSFRDRPITRALLSPYGILVLCIIPVAVSVYCLSRGLYDIFPHLFYIPIILIAYRYPRRGVFASILLGGIYLALVYLFGYPDIDVLSGATTRFFFFVAVGAVVTLLTRRIRDEEERYRGIFDNSQEGIFLLSGDLRTVLHANPRAAALLSTPRDALAGSDFSSLWQDSRTPDAIRAGMAREGRVSGLEGKVACRDGGVLSVLISAGVLVDGKVVCTVADISDRIEAARALERERQELLDIIEFLPDATFVIDRERRVIAWNRAIEAMTGVPKRDILGKGEYAYAVPFYGEKRPVLVDLIFERNPDFERRYEWVKREGSILYAEAFIPRLRNGMGAYLRAKASPLLDREGNVAGAIESVRDITEHRMAEEVLRESETNYRTVFNAANDAIFVYDLEDRVFLEVNRRASEMFGYSPEEMIRLSFEDLTAGTPSFTREDALQKIESLREVVVGGTPQLVEWMARDRSGRTFWVEMNLRVAPIWGEPRVLAVVRDITARKLAEEAIRASEANYRAIFNAVNEGIFIINPANGRILDANAKACEMYDRSVDDLRGLGMDALSDTEHGYNLEGGQEVFTKAVAGEVQSFEWRAKDQTGRLFWVEVNVRRASIGGEDRLLAVVRDITVRKQTEDITRIQHKLAERLGQAIPADEAFRLVTDALIRIEGIDATFACILDEDGKTFRPTHLQGFIRGMTSCPNLAELGDIEPSLVAGEAVFFHAGDAVHALAPHFTGENLRAVALLPVIAEGKIIAVLAGCSRSLDEFPEVTRRGLETIAHQIGINMARIRNREALEKSEALYRAVVEVQTEMISRFRPDGTHIFANEAYLRFFGKQRNGLIGKRFIPPIPDPDIASVRRHFSSLTQKNPVATIEHRVILPSGGIRWMQWTDRAIFDGDGAIVEYQSVGKDITETRMMEEIEEKAFLQIEKNIEQLAILGDHIRNPLAVIVGMADLEGGVTSERIIQQARIIDQIITQLDRGWIESEKIREYLRKNQ